MNSVPVPFIYFQHLTISCVLGSGPGPVSQPEGPLWWLPGSTQSFNPSHHCSHFIFWHPWLSSSLLLQSPPLYLPKWQPPQLQPWCLNDWMHRGSASLRTCLEREDNITWRSGESMPPLTSFDQWAIEKIEPINMSLALVSLNRHSGFKWLLCRWSALLWNVYACM